MSTIQQRAFERDVLTFGELHDHVIPTTDGGINEVERRCSFPNHCDDCRKTDTLRPIGDGIHLCGACFTSRRENIARNVRAIRMQALR